MGWWINAQSRLGKWPKVKLLQTKKHANPKGEIKTILYSEVDRSTIKSELIWEVCARILTLVRSWVALLCFKKQVLHMKTKKGINVFAHGKILSFFAFLECRNHIN